MSQQPIIIHMIDELKMGGAQTHLRTMLKYLQPRSKYKHVVVCLFGDGPIGDSLRDMGIEVINLDLSKHIQSGALWKAEQVIYNLLRERRPILLEAHLTYSRLLGLFAAFRAGVKKRYGFEQGDTYFSSLKWRIANFIGQIFTKKNIVCSNALKSWVQKTHGVFSSKLAVLYNCVDPAAFTPSVQSKISRKELGIPDTSFVFCAVGTLGVGVNKRMDLLIQAISKLSALQKDVYLLICGYGPLQQELEKLAESLEIKDRVKFLGMRNDVPDVMSISNSFCHAAPFEPFGIVCIEAMLIKLPVVIPDAGGIREIVDHGKTGLKYEALNLNDLTNQMLALVNSRPEAKAMGERGYLHVLKNMTVETYIKDLTKLYGI